MTTNEGGRVPTAAEEDRFWEMVEAAWAACGPEAAEARHALDLDEWLDQFLVHLERLSEGLSSAELTDLDRVVERKLHLIDREDIHEFTDGSDDGFLYCRGFIVAAGREFYEAVSADPSKAVMDAECEEMCYFFTHLHEKRFGSRPETGSGISRESGGW